MQKELLSKYETEVRKVWSTDEKMVKYCINNLSNLIELSDGSLYEIEKRKINTSFCYGHGQYGITTEEETQGALSMAAKARSDYNYFIEKNLEGINEMIEYLKGSEGTLYTANRYYNKDVNIVNVVSERYLREYRNSGIEYKPLTKEDTKKLLKAYQEEKEKFTKRLNTYLKRYGLSKIRSWTYLVD